MGLWGSIRERLAVVRGALGGLSRSPSTRGSYSERKLTADEMAYADEVFSGTVPLDRVFVANDVGLNDRPYTLPKRRPRDGYVVHLGAASFADARSPTLVHELTHVWQSAHRSSAWSYVLDSVGSQAWSWLRSRSTDGAYAYTVGQPWNRYGAEQQASIVEDWFEPTGWRTWDGRPPGDRDEADPRFRYIRDNIRAGRTS